jgi:hypothetical protein
MHLLAWVRLTTARHPWIYWLAVALVASGVGLGTARAMARVDAARRSWGEHETVWVASAAIEPGQPVVSDRRDVPRAMTPVGALGTAPVDVVARHHIGPGEIITDADIAAGGPAGLVPDGWVAFVVAASGDHFATGDHLRVYSGDQLVAAGLVVDRGESELMVAIPEAAAPMMATGILADAITIGLTPGR